MFLNAIKKYRCSIRCYLRFHQKRSPLWENRYPCGDNGGWAHVRILSEDDLDDGIKLIEIRKKPRIVQDEQKNTDDIDNIYSK